MIRFVFTCLVEKILVEFAQPPFAPSAGGSILTPSRLNILTLCLMELRNGEGVVNVALFSSADGFPNDADKAVRSGCFPITEQPLMIHFPDLPHGTYAATAHHDENMDAILNCNALGIPKEGIGFSNNPRIWKGVPPFHRAEFKFAPGQTQVAIVMKYLI